MLDLLHYGWFRMKFTPLGTIRDLPIKSVLRKHIVLQIMLTHGALLLRFP